MADQSTHILNFRSVENFDQRGNHLATLQENHQENYQKTYSEKYPENRQETLSENHQSANSEWQLSELVDTIAAEIDQAQDTLSLKSYARGLSFAVKTLSLNLEVKMRRDQEGKLLFRTVTPDQTSDTILTLDFAQVLQHQLTNVRKPLDGSLQFAGAAAGTLEELPRITHSDLAALKSLGIYATDDLQRYTQTPQMIAELSRKTQIEASRIRSWQNLPFITAVKPASGLPGSIITIEGGNFGNQPGTTDRVQFQQRSATIIDWQDTRLTVAMPAESVGSGTIVVQANQQLTNAITWEAIAADVQVVDLKVSPLDLVEGEDITVIAQLTNQGKADATDFEVQWEIDGAVQPPQRQSLLSAQQQAQTSVLQQQFSAGTHILRFTIDPNHKRPDLAHTNRSFTKQIYVRTLQRLSIADFRRVDNLNPLFNTQLEPANVLSLLFRGVGRLHPETGLLVPDLASSWQIRTGDNNSFLVMQFSNPIYWHNGQRLTALDIVSTYRMASQINVFWRDLLQQTISGIKVVNETTVAFRLQPESAKLLRSGENLKAEHPLAQLLTLGMLPQTYQANPEGLNQHPIGCGSFQVHAFTPGEMIQLKAFQQNAVGKPHFDRLDIRLGMDEHQLVKLIETHEIDGAVLPFSAELVKQLESISDYRLTVLHHPTGSVIQVQTLHLHGLYNRVLN